MANLFKRPKTLSEMVGAVNGLIVGAHGLSGELPLPAGFAPDLVTDRDALVGAMIDHKAKRDRERQVRKQRVDIQREADTFLTLLVNVMRPRFGTRFDPGSGSLGLETRSLARPANDGERTVRLESARDFLLADPTLESPNFGLTATYADDLIARLEEASRAMQLGIAEARKAKTQRDLAAHRLFARARGSAELLGAILEPEDMRWYTFGLRRPIDIRIPDAPAAPQVAETAPGTLEIQIPRSTRARRARIFFQRPEDPEPKFVKSVQDWKTVIPGVAPGELRITITTANGAGETRPSEPTFLQIHSSEAFLARNTQSAFAPQT